MSTRPKLTRDEAARVRGLVARRAMTQRQIAEEYGVHESTISRIVHDKCICYEVPR